MLPVLFTKCTVGCISESQRCIVQFLSDKFRLPATTSCHHSKRTSSNLILDCANCCRYFARPRSSESRRVELFFRWKGVTRRPEVKFKAKFRDRSSKWTVLWLPHCGNFVQISCNGLTWCTYACPFRFVLFTVNLQWRNKSLRQFTQCPHTHSSDNVNALLT